MLLGKKARVIYKLLRGVLLYFVVWNEFLMELCLVRIEVRVRPVLMAR